MLTFRGYISVAEKHKTMLRFMTEFLQVQTNY